MVETFETPTLVEETVKSQDIQIEPEEEYLQIEINDEQPIRPAVYKERPTFSFATKKISPSIDVYSKEAPTVEATDSGRDYYETSKFGYKVFESNPQLEQEWDSKGAIGVVETWNRFDKWGLLPYIGTGKDIVELGGLYNSIKKAKDGDSLTAEENKELHEFAMDMAEVDYRGSTIAGKTVGVMLAMPAFVGEFLTTGYAIGAGKGAVKLGVKAGVKKMAREGVQRTILNPQSAYKGFIDRRINDSISVTDVGEIFFKEGQEKPATSLIKAIGDSWVEQTSEVAGGYLFKSLGRKLPKGVQNGFKKIVESKFGMPFNKAVSKVGFDGILEEMGEEELGRFLRTTLNLDQEEGYSLEQFGKALFPGWEDMLVEAGAISAMGLVSNSTVGLVNRLAGKKKMTTQEREDLIGQVDDLKESDRRTLLQEDDVRKENEFKTQSIQVISDMAKERDTELVLEVLNNDQVQLNKIEVKEEKREKGIGSEVMRDVALYADKSGQTIVTTPGTDATKVERVDGRDMTVEELTEFYKKFGFVENKGANERTDIEAKMYRPPLEEDKGDTVSGLAKRMADKIKREHGVELKTEDLPLYEAVTNEEQLDKAFKQYEKSPENVNAIALGQMKPDSDILLTAYYVAATKMAVKNRDIDMLQSLATQSSITTETSKMGQVIQMLSQIDKHSPLKSVQAVAKSRVDNYNKLNKKDAKKEINEQKKALKEQVNNELDSLDNEIDDFINELEC